MKPTMKKYNQSLGDGGGRGMKEV